MHFETTTPAQLSNEQQEWFSHPKCVFPINSIDSLDARDGAGDCISVTDCFLAQHDGRSIYVCVLGLRQWPSYAAQRAPSYIAQCRVLLTAAQARASVGETRWHAHRSKARTTSDAIIFREERELFPTGDEVILTDKQLYEAHRVVVVEPVKYKDVLHGTIRRRDFDKFLSIAALNRIEEAEWFYWDAFVCHNRLDYNRILECTTLHFRGAMGVVSHQVCLSLAT
jgi:hypothetical protein